jgi:hypothetical protein
MNISLLPAQEEWLRDQAAAGRFASHEEAIASTAASLQAQDVIDDGWAKPLIDETLQAFERRAGAPWGEGLDKVLDRIKTRRSPGA